MKPRIRGKRSSAPVRKKAPKTSSKVKKIYDMSGILLMVGTEKEWRRWVSTRKF
jgi:hypothetical protein